MTSSIPSTLRPLLAECIGTFALVFAGTGAIVIDAASNGGIGHLGIGMTFGLIVMVMIYSFGHISGAHFNPAVTLGFAMGRHLSWARVGGYWFAQALGALLASLVLRAMFGNIVGLGATVPSGSATQSLVLEAILTLFLMLVITAVATDVRAVGQAAAIAIGATVGLEAIFGGPISGASMNPARSLAPALVSGTWTDQWIYVVGPIVGATIGVSLYQLVRDVTGEEGVEK